MFGFMKNAFSQANFVAWKLQRLLQ